MTDGLEQDIKDYMQNLTKELIDIKGSVGEIKSTLEVYAVKFEASCKQLEKVCAEVEGNGKVGIKESLREHLVRHDERNRVLTWMASIGGGGGLAGFITGMVAIFK